MQELFSGRLSPLTDTIGFLRFPTAMVAKEFVDWQSDIQRERGILFKENRINGDLLSTIKSILPLNSVETRRYLFIPTNSSWTAFLDNGHQGTDAFPPLSYLAEKLSCEAVWATYVPEGQADRYPATMLEIYGSRKTDFLNRIRSIALGFDGKKWTFSAEGEVQPFEDVQRYSERTINRRFTGEMLENYLAHMGIAAFSENFYIPNGEKAILVEKIGPIASTAREFALAEFRR